MKLMTHFVRRNIARLAAIGFLVALYLLAQGRTAVWDHYAALALPLGLVHAFLLALLYYGLDQLPAPEEREA